MQFLAHRPAGMVGFLALGKAWSLRLWEGNIRRRDFIKVIAGVAAAWPLSAHAQQPTIGYLFQRCGRIGARRG